MNLTDIFINSRRTLTAKLLDHVSSYDIFCSILGYELEIGKVVLSPVRKDSRPTFVLFIPENKDDVYFKDFAWVGGDVFKFVKLYAVYKEGINLNSRYDQIAYIDEKLNLGLLDGTIRPIKRRKIDTTFYASKRNIKFKSREFTKRDLMYWKQYHVTADTLSFYDVRSVYKLLNENNEVIYTVAQRTLTFAYVIFNKVKLYSPEAGVFKWRNTCPGYYLQGLPQVKQLIKKGETRDSLIITKSLKDVMVFFEFLSDRYHIIAPHSETYKFSGSFVEWIRTTYKKVVIIYDFDLAGVTGANRTRKQLQGAGLDVQVKFVSTARIKVNNKIKLIDKDISDYAVGRDSDLIKNHLISMGL